RLVRRQILFLEWISRDVEQFILGLPFHIRLRASRLHQFVLWSARREGPEFLRLVAAMPLEEQRATGPVPRPAREPARETAAVEAVALRAAQFQQSRRHVDVRERDIDRAPALYFLRPADVARHAD